MPGRGCVGDGASLGASRAGSRHPVALHNPTIASFSSAPVAKKERDPVMGRGSPPWLSFLPSPWCGWGEPGCCVKSGVSVPRPRCHPRSCSF